MTNRTRDVRRFSSIVLDALEAAIKIENILKSLNVQFGLQLRQDFQNDRYLQIIIVRSIFFARTKWLINDSHQRSLK